MVHFLFVVKGVSSKHLELMLCIVMGKMGHAGAFSSVVLVGHGKKQKQNFELPKVFQNVQLKGMSIRPT